MKEKLRAAGVHLVISIVIFIAILSLILMEWYPEPFFTAEGGWQGIKLMAFVDLVLGPLLTLIVFNHLKDRREVFFDLSLIVFIQISALIWGGYTVYTKRPIVLAFYEDAFYTVTNDYFEIQGVEKLNFSQYSSNILPILAVKKPVTESEVAAFNSLTKKGVPIYAHQYLYEPLPNQLDGLSNKQINIEEVMQYNEAMKNEIFKITNNNVNNYYYFPLQAKFHNMIVVLSKKGELVGIVKAPIRKNN